MIITSIDVGIKNLAYCVYDSETRQLPAWEVFSLGRTDDTLCPRVAQALNDRWESFAPAGTVVIERQMGSNRKMKIMEAYLHMYFVARGKNVVIFSATHKLEGVSGVSGKGKYHDRKRASVRLMDVFLADTNQANEAMYRKSAKKDDLADCVMQALAYVAMPVTAATAPSNKVVRGRRPTNAQQASGRYSRANIKFLMDQLASDTSVMVIADDPVEREIMRMTTLVERDATLLKSVKRLYGSPRACILALFPPEAPTPEITSSSPGTDVTVSPETAAR